MKPSYEMTSVRKVAGSGRLDPHRISLRARKVHPEIIPAPIQPSAQQTLQQTMADQKVVTNITLLSEAKVAATGLIITASPDFR